MFESDYIMRQIQIMTAAFNKIFFQKDTLEIGLFDEDDDLSANGVLYHRLKRLIADGRINEAEVLLFDTIEASKIPQYFYTALQFYQDLSDLSNDYLASCNFTRAEIEMGLRDVARLYEVEEGQTTL